MNNNFFKYVSILFLGLILGYLIRGWVVTVQQVEIDPVSGASVKVLGEENAPITMIEYSDLQCPLCKKFYDETFHTILDDYIKTGKVKYVFKHFPLNIHPQATKAALAAECGLEQNKFWEMHEALFEKQNDWSGQANHLEVFKQLAKDNGLDERRFNTCLDSNKYQEYVETDYQEGIARSIRGTPTFYINDQVLIGAQETSKFTKILDRELGIKPESQEAL